MSQSKESFSDLNDNGLLVLEVYFDVTCPYSYQAALWIKEISELMGSDIMAVRWRFFSLAQARRSKEKPDWNIWDQNPDNPEAQGLLAFAAGGAAYLLGGEQALLRFYLALGHLAYEEGKLVGEKPTIEQAWKDAGLSADALAGVLDGSNRVGYQKLQQDHTEAVERYNAFGTPTLVFEESRPFFLEMMPRPADITDSLELFQHVQRLAMGFKNVLVYKKVMTEAQQHEVDEMAGE
jgi:2-hydroxychromene-2-carboxylate isomerase